MRKLLYLAFTVLFFLGCSNNDDMPCVDCSHEYNPTPSETWCVVDIDQVCYSMQFLDQERINCMDGVYKDYCPAGYDIDMPSSSNSELIKKVITLSYANFSYADIDGDVAYSYRQAEVTGSILGKIDMIAYCGIDNWCINHSIYAPWNIGLFYDDNDYYIGSKLVYFLEIPPAQAQVFKVATTPSEIISTYNDIRYIFDDENNYLYEITIVANKAFFVRTSDDKICVVIIKATDNQSVDLEIIQIR